MSKKKKLLSVITAVIFSAAMVLNTAVLASADTIKTVNGVAYRCSDSGEQTGKFTGWAKNSKGRRYYKNGILYKNKWIKVKSGKRFYAGEDGYLTLGWYNTNIKSTYRQILGYNNPIPRQTPLKGIQPSCGRLP